MNLLIELGAHNTVQFGILREPVHKGQDDIAVKQKALAFTGMGDIRELVLGDVQLF